MRRGEQKRRSGGPKCAIHGRIRAAKTARSQNRPPACWPSRGSRQCPPMSIETSWLIRGPRRILEAMRRPTRQWALAEPCLPTSIDSPGRSARAIRGRGVVAGASLVFGEVQEPAEIRTRSPGRAATRLMASNRIRLLEDDDAAPRGPAAAVGSRSSQSPGGEGRGPCSARRRPLARCATGRRPRWQGGSGPLSGGRSGHLWRVSGHSTGLGKSR